MKYSLLASLMFCSCGFNPIEDYLYKESNDDSHHKPTVVNEDILPYVKRFETLFKSNVSIRVEYGELDSPNVGVCTKWSDGYKDITIDKEFFISLNDLGKEELIFHELGHCILNRAHTSEFIKINHMSVPKSIMYPYVFGEWPDYINNIDYYAKELLSK